MLGCGLVGGVFFAFSAFVMNALANLAPAQGIAAMQSINRSAIRPTFMIALFGTALTWVPVVNTSPFGSRRHPPQPVARRGPGQG